MHPQSIIVLDCWSMRTTVTLDADVAKALEAMRRDRGLGTSAALNELVRRGLATTSAQARPFVQRTSTMGPARVPLDDIGHALELLEGEAHG
jgi:hypothetical protein